MKDVECPENGEKKIEIVKDAQGRETIKQAYSPTILNVRVKLVQTAWLMLKLVLFEKVNGSWTVVSDNFEPRFQRKTLYAGHGTSSGERHTDLCDRCLFAGYRGNAYQGKHFHGNVVVNAFQTDEGAGAAGYGDGTVGHGRKGDRPYLVLFPEGETTMTLTPDL